MAVSRTCRVGKRVRLRHELHPQRGHQGTSGGRGGSQTGGDQHLPPEGVFVSSGFDPRMTSVIVFCIHLRVSETQAFISLMNRR